MAQTIVSQVRNHPDAVMELALSNLPKLSMDASSFGEFAQQMSELGLIFDIDLCPVGALTRGCGSS